jgi:hypothetical protein
MKNAAGKTGVVWMLTYQVNGDNAKSMKAVLFFFHNSTSPIRKIQRQFTSLIITSEGHILRNKAIIAG